MTEAIRELLRLEPVRVRAVAGALFALLFALGVDVPEDTRGTIVDFILNIAAPLLIAAMTFASARSKVTPVDEAP